MDIHHRGAATGFWFRSYFLRRDMKKTYGKWISLSQKFPPEYDWVLLGFLDDDEFCWQIGRYINQEGFQFWSGIEGGPWKGDSCNPMKTHLITHWFAVPPDLEEQ